MDPVDGKAQVKMETAETVLKLFGSGFSRLLRYSFGGFLAVAIAAKVNQAGTELYVKTLPWELDALTIVVVGVGIYAAHRSLVIPVHHWIACFLFWLWDQRIWRGGKNPTPAAESPSPTRWLRSLDVKPCRLMLAYSVLRRDPEFTDDKERERLDLAHAEFGLIVMMAEGCFVAAAYTFKHPTSDPAWCVWFIGGLLLLAASYPGPLQQHASECLRWRARENSEKTNGVGAVSAALKRNGLL